MKNKTIKKPEVLSPAGDYERLVAAVDYGADAVYLGANEFGMRSSANNFTFEQLKDAVEYSHSKNVKVYLTANTVPLNEEITEFPKFLKQVEQCGIDAIIVSDIGVLSLVREHSPNMEIHISTQAGVVNYVTANALYNLGAKRVVLARELDLEQIKYISDNVPNDLDIEAFVHGAMCMAFSGRCLISNYILGRDANRGECAQPCRWGYHLVEEKRPNEYYPVIEDEQGTHILNAKDLSMIEHLDKVIKSGVTSLKIEGRAKSSYYVSVVTNAYRAAVDHYMENPDNYNPPQWIFDEVKKVSHREYSTGFYFGKPNNSQYYENGGYLRTFDVIAIVDNCKDGYMYCTQKNKFCVGDKIEILQPKKEPLEMEILEMYDENNNLIESACHPLMKLKIKSNIQVISGSMLRKVKG